MKLFKKMTPSESLEYILKQGGVCTGVACVNCYFLRRDDKIRSGTCNKHTKFEQIIRERKLERILK